LLSVADAMQQVLDSMKLFEDAQQAVGDPAQRFVWKLERASANSPFTIIALAQPVDPTVDIANVVNQVKTEVARSIRAIVERRAPPYWMTQGSLTVARSIFARNLNGIGATDIDFEHGDIVSIKREEAAAAIGTLEAFNVLSFQEGLEERVSFGEIEGVMVAAGRYKRQEAVQIRNDLYGFIWCILPKNIVERFGGEHAIRDVWAGKTLGIYGRLFYAAGGVKISNIEAVDVREIQTAPPVNLDEILDPDFTAGMDPHEYLEKLHEGSLV